MYTPRSLSKPHVLVVSCFSQALLIRGLLEYSQCSDVNLLYGLALVGGIFLMELTRSWSLACMWAVNYRTATRLRGAALTFAFQKILRLRNTKDISTGEVSRVLMPIKHYMWFEQSALIGISIRRERLLGSSLIFENLKKTGVHERVQFFVIVSDAFHSSFLCPPGL